jgi:RNA polymerase sigma-32 factor
MHQGGDSEAPERRERMNNMNIPSGLLETGDTETLAKEGPEENHRGLPLPHTPLNFYMTQISRYPLLSREEEYEMARLVHDGKDPSAEEKLATSNLRLVVKIALQFYNAYLEILDLVQEGNVGLLHAVKKYDPDKGAKFSVYASFWIRAYILKYIMDSRSLVRIGTTLPQRKLFYRMNRANKDREDTTPRLLARDLRVKEREVAEMQQRLACTDLSLDAAVDDESDSTLMDAITGQEDIEDIVTDKEEHRIVSNMITHFKGTLNDREVLVLDRRIMSDDPASLREIGDTLRISHERVRQIEQKVIGKLGRRVEAERIAVGI